MTLSPLLNALRAKRSGPPSSEQSTKVPLAAKTSVAGVTSILPAKSIWSCQRHEPQAITFAPLAWLKLRHFLHSDHVEIGGFGISSQDDLLYIERFQTVKQTVGIASVEFDDAAVADYFDTCIDEQIPPVRCGRIWLHTHPGDSPSPSLTDEQTFERVFGTCDWAAMVIVARGGATYARLRFAAGPGGEVLVPVLVDWERLSQDLLDAEGQLDELFSSWFDEYGRNIVPRHDSVLVPSKASSPQRQLEDRDELDELYERQWEADHLDAWEWEEQEVAQ